MTTATTEPAAPTSRPTLGRKLLRGAMYLGFVLALLIGGVLAIAATKPDDLHVERTALISASPATVFAIINDLHRWAEWSPYDKYDPQMKKVLKGADSGPGAIYEWNGNENVGEGRLTIVDTKPVAAITMKLEFSRPFQCTNEVIYRLEPTDGGTRVSWIMDGKNTFLSKVMAVFIDMDGMVGSQFEEGLSNLNTIAKADQAKPLK